jgi:Mrp family chromosome partitioning ATPase
LSNLQTLRYSFDFVLLDCPSLKESGDAALFAQAADGVVVVVEADRTRKEQVRSTLNTIEMAEGNLLGCVLNKRQYPIPEWLYQRL